MQISWINLNFLPHIERPTFISVANPGNAYSLMRKYWKYVVTVYVFIN